jgi:lipid A 4'-phosphatase
MRAFVSGAGHVSALGILVCSCASFAVAAILFLTFPYVDVAVSEYFFMSDGRFAGKSPGVEFARNVFKGVYIAAVVVAIVGVWLATVRATRFAKLSAVHWLVVLLILAVGPGLIANSVFKDNWGRARPLQTINFGGTKEFTPALIPARECRRNCSFVSGEASSIFAVFFAFAVVSGSSGLSFIVLGLVGGSLAGLIRIAQGAHFLSDVVFAGIFMAMAAALVRIAVLDLALYRTRLGLRWERAK